jgi:putative IMPACT (imprinted ancient) family translation regulator
MAALKLQVDYLDGQKLEVTSTMLAHVKAERYYGGINASNKIEAFAHVAWATLHQLGKITDDFETWLSKVEDVDEIAPVATDPTLEAQSPETSSN